MSTLVIIAASLARVGVGERAIDQLLSSQSAFAVGDAVVLHPRALALATEALGETIAYDGEIGLEKHQALWRPLLARHFDELVVFGIAAEVDFEEIVLGCYLNAPKKTYMSQQGGCDMAGWQAAVRPDFAPREVRLRRLDAERQRAYFRAVHRWLGSQLVAADFGRPTAIAQRSPDVSIYQYSRLAADLTELTEGLMKGPYDASYSTYLGPDGSLVQSSDFYRSLANFVTAIDGIETVLDTGCGSGFLACHLAASGRYRDVLGIDSSPYRTDAAKLHAALNGSTARFETISMGDIRLPDRSVDLCVTSFALEQAGGHLERCLAEIRRVTRKLIVLFEPANEFFPTLPSLWHLPAMGWANDYHAVLGRSGLSYAVRPNLLRNYYNPGAVFVIDLESREHPRCRYPQLFEPAWDAWPGGVRFD